MKIVKLICYLIAAFHIAIGLRIFLDTNDFSGSVFVLLGVYEVVAIDYVKMKYEVW